MASDETIAANLNGTFCTCQERPLGLPFVLTYGCLMHDACVCHEVLEEARETCAWCASYLALLKAIGSLDDGTREQIKRDYIAKRASR